MRANVGNHLFGIFQILNLKINLIDRSIGHSGLQGAEIEQNIRQLLIDFLPSNYGVSSGIIIGTNGDQSKQIDIIIYDKNRPNYTIMENSKLFLADHVIAAIEIKTTYTTKTLIEALENAKSVKDLTLSNKKWNEIDFNEREIVFKERQSSAPLTIVFFFSKPETKGVVKMTKFMENFEKIIAKYDIHDRPDLLFSLSHSFTYKFDDLVRKKANELKLLTLVPLNRDQEKVISIEGLKESNKYLIDFSNNFIFSHSDGEIPFTPVGNYYCKEGDSNQALFYEVAKFKSKFYLLDKFRSFYNFIWLLEKMVSLKKTNPVWDIQDYFGSDITRCSSLDEI